MKKTITEYEFTRAFTEANRGNNFSYDGLKALFEYLEAYEEDAGEEIELDVISLCCEYAEYSNLEEFQKDYGTEYETLDAVRDATMVIGIDDERFIIACF